jgi:hypothetical protein
MRAYIAVGLVMMMNLLADVAASDPQLRVTAATNSPRAGMKWKYAVRSTPRPPVAAKLTVRIVDTFGGKHPVGFHAKPGNIEDVAFDGVFEDAIIWPEKAVGWPLKLRAIVVVGDDTQTVDYELTVKK